jgi:hypothetical protein
MSGMEAGAYTASQAEPDIIERKLSLRADLRNGHRRRCSFRRNDFKPTLPFVANGNFAQFIVQCEKFHIAK